MGPYLGSLGGLYCDNDGCDLVKLGVLEIRVGTMGDIPKVCGCCGGEIISYVADGELIHECYGCSGVVGAFGCAKYADCKIDKGELCDN